MPNYSLGTAPEDYKGDAPKSFPLIPEDTTLVATITEIKEDVKPFNDRETGLPVVKLAWTFQTAFDDQERKVWGETNLDFFEHPDCRLYSWTQEALGTELPNGFVLNTDALIGQDVRVIMGVRSYVKNGETDKRYVNYVKDVMRARSAMGAATQVAADPF